MSYPASANFRRLGLLALTAAAFFLLAAAGASAEQPKDMGGWEIGSPYNQHYDPKELDYFRANIVDVMELVPMEGMSPAVALKVQESPDDEPIVVHLCPVWFAEPGSIGLKKGDRVKIKGVWTEIDGKDVFMASKVKKGDYFQFKVRLTKDGTPFWTMTPEMLAKEMASD